MIDSVATHSFIFTQSAMQVNLEIREAETNYRVKLSNDSRVECSTSHKHVSITVGGIVFSRVPIHFDH